jgi:SAM-dependent methyltransferase
MFCHGELVRLKPVPRYLTRFYLMVSLGGALGSAGVGILAPLILPADFELGGALVVCTLLLLWQVRREPAVYGVLGLVALCVTIGCAAWAVIEFYRGTLFVARNFYGVLRVQEIGEGAEARRNLIHGNIMHGKQYLDADLATRATSYYTPDSGIGRLIESLHPRKDPIKVGIIGLGVGTIAAYGSKGDVYRFYDINPGVLDIARTNFSYLAKSDATIELPLGDARLKLEREAPQQFDVLAIDAFSSDAIPVHLITKEAVQIYLKHMKPDGVIAFHVTNRYLDLVPVVEGIAHELDLHALWISDPGADPLGNSSSWVLLARDPGRLNDARLAEAALPITPRRDWRVWTDDFNNVVQVLK